MARPFNANPDSTRKRLLDAAIALFASEGFHGASTRELAARAKVNVATISLYYRDKQGLHDATIDEVYRRIMERARAAVGDLSSVGPHDLDELTERVYRAARGERDGIRLLLREVLDHGRLRPRTEAKHFLPGLETTAELAARMFGFPRETARTAMVALGYLISRYVIQDDASLKSAFGVRTVDEAHQRAASTLAVAARALLAPPTARSPRSRS